MHHGILIQQRSFVKVFISWSGRKSQNVAEVMRNWLPLVLHSVKPFVSTEDIGKGQYWNARLTRELSDTSVGLIMVTRENAHAEWLQFEAGALSNALPMASVCPVLIDLKQSDVPGTFAQFQCTTMEKDDLRKLVQSLNVLQGSDSLSDSVLNKTFEAFYPELIESIHGLLSSAPTEDEGTHANAGPASQFFIENYVNNSEAFQASMRNATTISVLGYTQNRITGAYSSELDEVCSRNGTLRFLLIDPESNAVEDANLRSYSPKDVSSVRHQHAAALALLASIDLNRKRGSIEVRVLSQMPPFTVFIFDESEVNAHAYVWLMPWREPSRKRPGFRIARENDRKWFNLFFNQFASMWQSEHSHRYSLVRGQ
jgi:hypothetical protein